MNVPALPRGFANPWWAIPAGLTAGTLFLWVPDRVVLLPFLVLLFLWPSRDARVTATVLLAGILVLASTHISWIRTALQDMRWAGYALFLLVGWRFLRARRLSGNPLPRGWFVVFGVLVLAAIASIPSSIDPFLSVRRFVAFLLMSVSVLFIVYRSIDRVGEVERLAVALLGLCFLIVGVSLAFDAFDGRERVSRLGFRLMGILGNPITLGDLIALMLPLAVWWFLWRSPRKGGILVAVFLIALFETEARSSIVAAVAGCGYVLAAGVRMAIESPKTRRRLFGVVAFAVAAALVLFSYAVRPETFWELGGRLEHWTVAGRLIAERPWLGYGFGTEDRVFDWAHVRLKRGQGSLAHNTFLGLALQVGSVAASVFAVAWGIFAGISLKRSWRGPSSSIGVGLTGCLISGSVTMIFETWAFSAGSPFAFLFWCLMVMLLRQMEIQRKCGEKAC